MVWQFRKSFHSGNVNEAKVLFNLMRILSKLKWNKNNEEYFFECHVQHPKNLHNFHNNLLFLPERMELKKVQIIVFSLHNKDEHIIQTKNLKQVLNLRLTLMKFNEKS